MKEGTFFEEHLQLTRRHFIEAGIIGIASAQFAANSAFANDNPQFTKSSAQDSKPIKTGAQPDPYFTAVKEFQDVSRGNPLPHSLSEEKKVQVGLTRDTWRLQVLSDPDYPSTLGKQFTNELGTAIDFNALLKLGEKHAVRFPKVMTCLNLGCPLGMGLWEGVPLREVIWLTRPRDNLRRVFYYGYHNDDPAQMFRSSLPIGRVLEDPYDLPPVILCYKLNGEWLNSQRGGPVRIVVPESYGFKSIKWLTHVFLTNLAHANDTYADQNNDVDSPLKTFAATLTVPNELKAGQQFAVTGYAQVGISGLSKVQVSLVSDSMTLPEDDPYFNKLPWVDAQLFAVPKQWSSLPEGKIPDNTHGFDDSGNPKQWPMRLCNAHWAAVLPGQAKGVYTLRCRTIDDKGQAQPMPRPFRKSGHSAIESVDLTIE